MNDLKVLLRLLALFRPYRGWMLLGALLASITVLASVALMAVAGWFIAAMATAGMAGVLMNYFLPAAGIRAFAILRTGGRYAERVVSHEATFRLLARLRVWLFRKLVPLAPAQLQNHRGADLVSRIQADIDTLQHAYLRLYSPLVVALVGTAVVVAVLALFSPAVAMVVLALLLVAGALVPGLVYRAASTPGAQVIRERAALRVALVDALQGMTDLRVQGAQERMAETIAGVSERLGAHQSRVARLGSLSEGMVGLCANLATWSAAALAMLAAGAGTLAPEQVPMLALAAFASFEAVAPLPLAMQRVGEIAAAARRIFALADEVPAIAPVTTPSPTPLDSSIHFHGVRMRYDAAGPLVLDGIDLDIPAGRRVAVIGPSGAGKTSLARVLLRFWDYEGGEIRFGGHDLRAYRQDDLFRLIGVLSQDTQLLNASVRENLLVAAPDADMAAMERAMRAAQLHDFIAAQPHGYDSWIGEGGVRLSLGQARRLALARVLLRDPSILILDEPTEGLDAPTGRALMEAVMDAMAGRTLLVITHRPEEVRDLVDDTVRLTDGRLVRGI
ncbi:thiol reductant ABC exporter subunit CydC [Ancylobacter sp. A5.8]|uniref:thiol reductant ABC exporter subunit CydC n=1 Tax=Ancylobacter gelatini TaxID=2919920 RepID=UPI001F4D78C4|nr:thiol reductant ABC exporter subunit CydC [Ancylobacter gelatini]MCJ8144345.1 thiol reductant ABC exporter subunit CydC [Ancylobacter gelatini]